MPKYNKHICKNIIFALIITIAPTPKPMQKKYKQPNITRIHHGPKHNLQIFKKSNEKLFTTPKSIHKEIHEKTTKNEKTTYKNYKTNIPQCQ
jgi:hypothetical protein